MLEATFIRVVAFPETGSKEGAALQRDLNGVFYDCGIDWILVPKDRTEEIIAILKKYSLEILAARTAYC